MGTSPHSLGSAALTAVVDPVDASTPRPVRPSRKAREASSPYAEKTRGYYHTLSATSVGLEMAVSVVLPLFVGMWLDRELGSTPWMMLLCLAFGFAAGVRALWRHVAASDRLVKEAEADDARAAVDEAKDARHASIGKGGAP